MPCIWSLIACLISGCKRTPCWRWSFWRIAPSRRPAPVADMLKPSCSAIRLSSALTMGLTQRSRWTAVVLAVFPFVVRVLFRCKGFARGYGSPQQAAPWLVARMQSALYLALPQRLLASPLPPLIAAERRIVQVVQSSLETIGDFATLIPLSFGAC
jgi:hypothetical protein